MKKQGNKALKNTKNKIKVNTKIKVRLKSSNGITLIALVISIIVMIILAGVSLNATIGENGIVTRASEAKILQGIAVLQEQINFKKTERVDEFENIGDISITDFSYNEYPKDGFLTRVSYGTGDTYVFNLDYIDRLSKELKDNLVGGEGINDSLALVRNVYGINQDFKVWYVDADGKLYGQNGIVEIPIDPNEVANASQALKEGMGVTGDLTVGDVRGRRSLTIDGSKMRVPLTNVDELSLFPNLTELTLKNLNLTDIEGLQYSSNIQKIWLDNTKITDYSGLKFGINVTGFYAINNSVNNSNIVAITDQFANMTKLDTVRIRNNEELSAIPALNTIGNIKTLWIEENVNLTNIYGLSTVNNKTSLINLYLNENNLTDVVNTEEKDKTYGYIIPEIKEGNVINMSYIDEYTNLEILDCSYTAAYSSYYENHEPEQNLRYNKNLHYLVGIKSGKKVGINNLVNLKNLTVEYCDILDVNELITFQNMNNRKLNTIKLLGNENFTNLQINSIVSLLNSSTYTISGKYMSLLGSNKPYLNYANMGITDLSFLDGNKITTSLDLSSNGNLSDDQMQYIGKMTQLQNLRLVGCTKITNFSFLSSLPNLTNLDLRGTKVSDNDIKNLTCKNSLLELNLSACYNMKNVTILNDFTNEVYAWTKKQFDIRGWGILDNADLSYFNNRNYTALAINKGDLTTMQPAISKITETTGLNLNGDVNMLKKLERCTEITNLRISSEGDGLGGNNNYNGATLNLSACTKLNELYFMGTNISELNLTGCISLRKCTIHNMMRGKKWTPSDFSKNIQLNYLNLTNNLLEQTDLEKIIKDITPVYTGNAITSGAPNIQQIYLNRNDFSSLTPFANLAGKTSNFELHITDNNLISLSGIEDLRQLTILDIQNNPAITNITPILTLKGKEGNNLTTVKVKGCTGITSEMKTQMRNAGLTVEE